MPLQGMDVLKWTALRPGADKRSSSHGSLRNHSLVCVQDFGLGFNFATSNPFPVILNASPPSLILKRKSGGLVLILGGFPAPTGMTGTTVIRL